MTQDARILPGDQLREAMRRWVTGVSIVTSQNGHTLHGMTVNSFVSVALEPPLITVTLAHSTRTYALVKETGYLGVSILSQEQAELSDRFAGRVPEGSGRFNGVGTFMLNGQAVLISGCLVGLACKVAHTYEMAHATMFICEVQAAYHREDGEPLVYNNRAYHRLAA